QGKTEHEPEYGSRGNRIGHEARREMRRQARLKSRRIWSANQVRKADQNDRNRDISWRAVLGDDCQARSGHCDREPPPKLPRPQFGLGKPRKRGRQAGRGSEAENEKPAETPEGAVCR